MSIKGGKSILGLEQGREQHINDERRMNIITCQLETWSTMNCVYRPRHPKKCRCLGFLHSPMTEPGALGAHESDEGVAALKYAVASYILAVSKMKRLPAKMLMMEKMKVAEGWIKSDDLPQPFAIPFIVETSFTFKDIRDADILRNTRICKHAFGTLHMYGKHAM